MTQRISNLVTATIPLIMMGIVLLALPASVNGQSAKDKVQSKQALVRNKIEALQKEVARLQDEGAADKAEALAKIAEQLKSRLAKGNENPKRKKSGGNQAEILNGLKAGAASLRALGRLDEAERLEGLAADIRKKAAIAEKRAHGSKNEREVAMGQIKIMRAAMQGLIAADREDLAAMIEHTIHAQELALEGVRNKKAVKVRETAPSLGQRVELLNFAARKLRDAGKKEQASAVGKFAEQLMVRLRAQQKRGSEGEKREGQRKEREEGASKERQVAAGQIELMQVALVALREGDRKDSAELLNRAIQARLIRLKSLKGEEAKYVLEREPKPGQVIEVLQLASRLWREFGNQKNTAVVRNLAEQLAAGNSGRDRERAAKERAAKERAEKQRGAKKEQVQQVNQLKEEIAKLKASLEKRLVDLKEIENKNRR